MATSFSEAEYVAIEDVMKEAMYVRRNLKILEPLGGYKNIMVHEDNEGAIQLESNRINSSRSRRNDVNITL